MCNPCHPSPHVSAGASAFPAEKPFVKGDFGKLRYDLLPPKAIEDVVRVLTLGSKKYAPNNWVKAPEWSRYYAALQRHLHAWWSGEDKDEESGVSHLSHAICCALFLAEFERLGLSRDDRPKDGSDK